MHKIAFFDVDGTLVTDDSEHYIPDSTRRAIHLARECGHLLFVNTGRPLVNVDADIRSLGFDGFVCGCGTYVECDGKELFYQTVPRDICRKMVELVRACNASPLYERRDAFFFDSTLRVLPMLAELKHSFRMQEKNVTREVDDEIFGFDKFVICYDEQTDLDRFKEEIAPYFAYIDRGYGFAEMVPLACSKATGMKRLLAYYGVDKSHSYAIGDSLNDLPMFESAGTCIAMGNGEKLIPYADYVTDTLEDDGIWNALAHFGFFEKG